MHSSSLSASSHSLVTMEHNADVADSRGAASFVMRHGPSRTRSSSLVPKPFSHFATTTVDKTAALHPYLVCQSMHRSWSITRTASRSRTRHRSAHG